MNRSTQSASGLATVISGTLQSGTNSPALYERSGLISISQAIDAYMVAYEGRDESRPQRMAWWQAKIGHLTLLEVDEDHIFYAIEELASKKPRYYAGKDAAVPLKFRKYIKLAEIKIETNNSLANTG